jgi:hypothetical protein
LWAEALAHDLCAFIWLCEPALPSCSRSISLLFDHELAVGASLSELSDQANPEHLAKLANSLRNTLVLPPKFADLLDDSDPFSLIPLAGREAVLSPIRVVQIFRQYFFELDNFWGPAVEHIWLAPGTRIELYEVSTRKTIYEETIERSMERALSSESTNTQEDELSKAIRSEDTRNTKLRIWWRNRARGGRGSERFDER